MDKIQEYNIVIEYIINEIDKGRLIEGSRLPSERELTEKLGISRNLTREAISVLRGMGIVDSRLGSGNYIVNKTDKSIKYMIEIMLKLGSISIKEIFDYRYSISRAVGAQLIENGISEEYVEKINNILMEMKDASKERFCELDKEFHISLINATGNKLFMKVMDPVGELYTDIIVAVIMSDDKTDREERILMHERILKSILSKDEEACIRYIKKHYEYVRDWLVF